VDIYTVWVKYLPQRVNRGSINSSQRGSMRPMWRACRPSGRQWSSYARQALTAFRSGIPHFCNLRVTSMWQWFSYRLRRMATRN